MKTLIKAYKYAFRLDAFLVIMSFINALAYSVIPFVSMYYGGIILNMLVAKDSFESILNQAWILIWLDLVLTAIIYFSTRAMAVGDSILESKLREAISEKNLRLDFAVLEDQKTKAMLTKAEEGSNGSGGLADFINSTVPAVIKSVVKLAFSCLFISQGFISIVGPSKGRLYDFLNNPLSFLVIIGEIIVILVISFMLMNKINKFSYKLYTDNINCNREYSYIDTIINDYKYAKDFRIFHMRDMIMGICQREFITVRKNFDSFVKKITFVYIAAGALAALLLFSSYLYVGAKAYYGIIQVGALITVVGSISSFTDSLVGGLSGISQGMVQSKYLSNYFDYLELGEKDGKKEPIPEGDGLIEFKQVYFKYPNAKNYALEDVSFTIEPKKRLAIVGRNGAGKSTIIKLIARFYLPEKGEIDFNGKNINDFDFQEYQQKLGILFQDFSLFAFTLKENVSSLPDCQDEAKVSKCLDMVGYDYKNTKKLPQGLDTYLYKEIEEGAELSGGEEQKVGIARALYKDSPVVLLDEPTSALDPLSEQTVYNSIDKLVTDRTSVFISHRMSSTKFCDHIIVLDKGKVIQEGTHQSLMKDAKGMYALLFNEQAKYYI